jgi:hypothetical protein
MKVRKCSRVEDEQHTVHIAKALVVFVNKFTLGAPFHATSPEMTVVDGACGLWKLE